MTRKSLNRDQQALKEIFEKMKVGTVLILLGPVLFFIHWWVLKTILVKVLMFHDSLINEVVCFGMVAGCWLLAGSWIYRRLCEAEPHLDREIERDKRNE